MVQYSPPVASHSVDCTVFGFVDKQLKILLIRRASEPSIDQWALPNGFMEEHETLEEAAERLLDHLTGVNNLTLQQIGTYSDLKRHPLGRVITTAFIGFVRPNEYWLNPTWHAKEAIWCNIDKIPVLAFDHNLIINKALKLLQKEIQHQSIVFDLVDVKFTLSEIQAVFETVLNEKIDKRNFRRKIERLNILIPLDDVRKGSHIEAKLFAFNKKAFDDLPKNSFSFN